MSGRNQICSRQRLARALARLEEIQLARSLHQEPLFGQLAEERIIWRELLDLELQYVDEEIERISEAAGGTDRKRSQFEFKESRHD